MSHQFQNYQLVSHHKSPSKNIVQPVERLGPAGIWVKETGPMLNYSQGHSDLFQNCKRFKSHNDIKIRHLISELPENVAAQNSETYFN
ncbi:hypothetical protein OUZ56_006114 [Daphnia magna]|uniref:Uncharacterized protein n=1 Tax=Daphnia magna TaxID=35525 RepID=A0ABQ9YUP9_9CRUS|nr:hypothetical protein OUZ56_006114 [Daphnia magna]